MFIIFYTGILTLFAFVRSKKKFPQYTLNNIICNTHIGVWKYVFKMTDIYDILPKLTENFWINYTGHRN